MTPFYFGKGERQLFGIYEAAQRPPARRAVLLCHPWGGEYIHAYRALRHLAKMLAASGLHVMRFDYYGTGDSAGDSTAADPQTWTTDVRSAIEELRDTSGVTRVSLVGLRLGAALAAAVAASPDVAIDSLVLWDPVLCGADYLAELHRDSRTGWLWRRPAARRSVADGGGHEILGFPLTDRMAMAMREIDLASVASALPERTLVVTSRPPKPRRSASRPAAPDGRALERLAVECIPDEPAWVEWPIGHPLAGTVPTKVLGRIVEWLTCLP